MIIGLDLDGVTVRYIEGLRSFVANSLGLNPNQVIKELPDPTDYGFSNWKILGGEFKKHHTDAVDLGLYASLTAFEDASRVLWELSNKGDHIRVITSRFVKHGQNALVVADTAKSLDINNIPYRDLMFVKNKIDVFADIYIDDAPHNIEAFQSVDKYVIIFDAPYNQHCVGDRAYNWVDAERLIEARRLVIESA